MEVLVPIPSTSVSTTPISSQLRRDSIGFGSRGPCRVVSRRNLTLVISCSTNGLHRSRSNLESLFCYDKSIPEEKIEKPVGLSLKDRDIGDYSPCVDCSTKGVVLCATCSGSGLYVDSILESQGIIVKVRCLGCGGTGNVMCSECGGRGHVGI